MKKLSLRFFPLLFALLTLVLFLLVYRPGRQSPAMTSAGLVFLTSLGWSALIVFGSRKMRLRRIAYPVFALLASLLLVTVLRPFPVDPLPHHLMIAIEVLGMVGIALYLRILNKEGENPHD